MKVAFREFGPIHDAEIHLKPLTIFMGPNNTGKTWAAYAIAALFSSRSFVEYIKNLKDNGFSDDYPFFDEILKKLAIEGNAKVDLQDIFKDYGHHYLTQLADLMPKWFNNFMGSRRNPFHDSKIEVELDADVDSIVKKIKEIGIEGRLSVSKEGTALLNCLKEPETTIMHFFTTDKIVFERFPSSEVMLFIARNILQVLQRVHYFNVTYFPSERTALTPLAFLLKTKKQDTGSINVSNEGPIRDAEVDMLLPGPVIDLLSLLFRAQSAGDLSHRIEEAKKDKNILKYIQLAELLQTNIMGGRIDFQDPKPDPLRDLLFTPSGNEKISVEMPITSSVVKELSPLALYLNYFASSNELIVIDEPEMNLHPKAQAQIAEFLCLLVNAGINVIITTHSPYIIDHLMNLIKAHDNENKEQIKEKFYLKNVEAFISKDKVAAYLFDSNSASSNIDEDGFIDWHTFSKESESISNLYFEL